mmetsp:Transcript_38963/g.110348  ORF Transcript_38963/g.110348 Transcript_38963/m.110348 type:complete len:97 (-) Transcript_38963:285-575(-)
MAEETQETPPAHDMYNVEELQGPPGGSPSRAELAMAGDAEEGGGQGAAAGAEIPSTLTEQQQPGGEELLIGARTSSSLGRQGILTTAPASLPLLFW